MRSSILSGLTAFAFATVALGCSHDERPARSVSSSAVAPQTAMHDPTVSPSSDPRATRGTPGDLSPSPPVVEPTPAALEAEKRSFADASGRKHSQALAKTEKALSDGQVMGVLLAANEGEIQLADMATQKASSTNVKQFAAMMKTHHTSALMKTKGLETKARITTAESDLATYLRSDAVATSLELRDKDASAFDHAYLDAQVRGHKDVLAAIDNRLMPSASNGEIRSILVDTRRLVAGHLTKAEELQRSVDGTASLPPTIGPGMPGHASQPQTGKHAMTASGH